MWCVADNKRLQNERGLNAFYVELVNENSTEIEIQKYSENTLKLNWREWAKKDW